MDLEGIKIKACSGVYEPREDSYLLAQMVEKYAFGSVLDLGTGSGIQGIVAAKKGCNVVFSDIDEKALECAKENAVLNGVTGTFVESDMFSSIKGAFNTIIFNPPYLPEDGSSKGSEDIALDGGYDGRKYIDIFLKEYKNHIANEYAALWLESSLNSYENDVAGNAKIVASSRLFFEELVVVMASNRF
ncbi:MAG: methyltransferase [Candidatus Marsarchaeota archaeon]|nr:methyltransferase [Candidatus Marsarchaeota archaeon]MCL5418539.1 methyltransferase [Candidatus Marsarchaeota archaeon]